MSIEARPEDPHGGLAAGVDAERAADPDLPGRLVHVAVNAEHGLELLDHVPDCGRPAGTLHDLAPRHDRTELVVEHRNGVDRRARAEARGS